MRDENQETPDDFLNEIHKWSLECKFMNQVTQFLYHVLLFKKME